MTQYMLDTNAVSDLIKEHPGMVSSVMAAPMTSLCISAITEGELYFGLAKRPDAKRLHLVVGEFLRRVDVLAWDRAVAQCYGTLRADMEGKGKKLGSLDMLIAAHALSSGAVLVTNDQTFSHIPNLHVEDWSD
ncbi:MAG: type II toxin-antitoxin system VapC family toxin [Acidimicrobiales bacterium]